MALCEENPRAGPSANLLPVIGYAEPSTGSSIQKSSANGHFKLFAFAALLLALMFIGGTLGSLFIDLAPARPWEAQVSVRVGGAPTSPGELAAIKRDRNLIAANPLARVFYSDTLHPWANIPDNDFFKAAHVSQVQPDGSFIVNITSDTEKECNRIIADYSNMPLQMPSFQVRPFQVSYGGAQLTEAAVRAPKESCLIGSGVGMLAGLLFVLWRLRSGKSRLVKSNA